MIRIAVLDDYQSVAADVADWSALPDSPQVEFFSDHLSDETELVERLLAFDVIAVMRERTPFPASLFGRLPRLRLLVTPGMRNAAIDLDAAREHGVLVCGTPGGRTSTAELTWALILGLARHIPTEDAGIRSGEWQRTVGTDLAGKTLGLLGLGKLGQRVARIGLAFNMSVIAWSQNLTDAQAESVGVRRVEKSALFAESDVLSIHVVLSDRTRGLVGAAELATMKSSALLINTARGPILDEDALVTALHTGQIAGAGLDVFDQEPLRSGHPLLSAPNTVLTPHLGFVTEETYREWYSAIVEVIADFLRGTPRNVLT